MIRKGFNDRLIKYILVKMALCPQKKAIGRY